MRDFVRSGRGITYRLVNRVTGVQESCVDHMLMSVRVSSTISYASSEDETWAQ